MLMILYPVKNQFYLVVDHCENNVRRLFKSLVEIEINEVTRALQAKIVIIISLILLHAGQKKNQVQLPGASKFSYWASENGSLVVWWASEISLSSLVVSSLVS